MSVCVKKDTLKYKQHPYFEKPNKKDRITINRGLDLDYSYDFGYNEI